MGSFSIWHWLIVLVIVALVFGTKKIRNMGSDLGGAVKGFKDGMREASDETEAQAARRPPESVTTHRTADDTIDVQAKEKSNS